jgi:hypothetical protein
MFPLQGVCVSSISRRKVSRIARMLGLLLAVFLVSGTLQATPISDHDTVQFQNAKHRPAFLALSSRGKAAVRLASMNSVQRLSPATIPLPSSSGCLFAGECANPVHIPESGALAVLGTGLLSIAGLLRRRLRVDR